MFISELEYDPEPDLLVLLFELLRIWLLKMEARG